MQHNKKLKSTFGSTPYSWSKNTTHITTLHYTSSLDQTIWVLMSQTISMVYIRLCWHGRGLKACRYVTYGKIYINQQLTAFRDLPTLVMTCDVVDIRQNSMVMIVRTLTLLGRRARAYLQSFWYNGVYRLFLGPEHEFFVFWCCILLAADSYSASLQDFFWWAAIRMLWIW